jgi:hypothetical protein
MQCLDTRCSVFKAQRACLTAASRLRMEAHPRFGSSPKQDSSWQLLAARVAVRKSFSAFRRSRVALLIPWWSSQAT